MASIPTTNSLGLDFNVPEASPTLESAATQPADPTKAQPASPYSPSSATKPDAPMREKKKPYVNPDRVKTGGPQREKLTDEELAERMARMREQNEKIKQRRLDVAADEAAFKQTQEADRQKMERTKKIQDGVDKAREQNVKRKMDKVQNREWDSGKPASADWKNQPKQTSAIQDASLSTSPPDDPQIVGAQSSPLTASSEPAGSGNWVRGGRPSRGGRGRGRGRGRGGRGGHPGSRSNDSVSNKNDEDRPEEDGQAGVSEDAASPTPS